MKSKHDGERLPDHIVETREQIHRTVETKGAGGVGLHETSDDALRRGVGPRTPTMAKRTVSQENNAVKEPLNPTARTGAAKRD